MEELINTAETELRDGEDEDFKSTADTEKESSDTAATDGENTAEVSNDEGEDEAVAEISYEEIAERDLTILKSEFPELTGISDISELNNPLRYAALRDLGLTPAEAYLATAKRARQDNRSHLRAAYGKRAAAPSGIMSQKELSEARELFGNLADSEIIRLYRKVTT